ncbi:hypothetical protein ACJMK2_040914 [Sinanodonta woodiana]|uniref:Uncharacterized protein n=1 Tax=Sinanodonta woodiana TaxID=1069815 RepID=A0ABD3W2I0_SINWO
MEFIAGLLLFILFDFEYSHGQYFPLPQLSSVHPGPHGPIVGAKSGPVMIQEEHSRILPAFQQFPFPISPRMGHKPIQMHALSLGIKQDMVPGRALHLSGQISPSLGIHPGVVPGNIIDHPGQPSVNHRHVWPLPIPNTNPPMHQQSAGISLSMVSPLATSQFVAEGSRQRALMNHMPQQDVVPFSSGGAIFKSSIQQRPVFLSPVQPHSIIKHPLQLGSVGSNVVGQGTLMQVSPSLTRSPLPLVNRNEHQALSNYLVNDVHQANRQLPIFSGNFMHLFPPHNLFSGIQVFPGSRQSFSAATDFGENIQGDVNSIQHAPSPSKSESEAEEERRENEIEQLEDYFEQREEMGLLPAWNTFGFLDYIPEYVLENKKIIVEPPELDQDIFKGLVKDKNPEKAVDGISVDKRYTFNKSTNGLHMNDSGMTAGPAIDQRVHDKESDIVENAKESPRSSV